ncbi:MAG TPA: hypothetical protein VGP72_32455 [Planctomycetota bacterium]|jgi:hypothetical protein
MSGASTLPSGWWTKMILSDLAGTLLSPSPTASNGAAPTSVVPLPPSSGRDPSTGRFSPGNRLARGNPFGQRQARLRTALLEAVTEDDLRSIIHSLIEKAKAGDVAATRLLFDYSIGKPVAASDPDRTEIEGDEITRENSRVRMRQHEEKMKFGMVL